MIEFLVSKVNLIFCIIVSALGIVSYEKTKKLLPLFIAVAFILYGVSHLIAILGFKEDLAVHLVAIRTTGYIFMALGLYKLIKK